MRWLFFARRLVLDAGQPAGASFVIFAALYLARRTTRSQGAAHLRSPARPSRPRLARPERPAQPAR